MTLRRVPDGALLLAIAFLVDGAVVVFFRAPSDTSARLAPSAVASALSAASVVILLARFDRTVGLFSAAVVLLATVSFVAGMMYDTCDINMRPFLLQLIVLLVLPDLVVLPLATPMMALAIVAIAAALTRAARSHRAPRIVFVAAAAGAGVIVGAIGALAGAHPVPGNCVL